MFPCVLGPEPRHLFSLLCDFIDVHLRVGGPVSLRVTFSVSITVCICRLERGNHTHPYYGSMVLTSPGSALLASAPHFVEHFTCARSTLSQDTCVQPSASELGTAPPPSVSPRQTSSATQPRSRVCSQRVWPLVEVYRQHLHTHHLPPSALQLHC